VLMTDDWCWLNLGEISEHLFVSVVLANKWRRHSDELAEASSQSKVMSG